MAEPTSQMKAILDAHAALGPIAVESLEPELARLIPLPDRAAIAYYGQHFTKRALAPMPLPVGKVEHRTISADEGEILTRIYTPNGSAPAGGWPVLVYFHGGGWVIANLDTYDSSCRALCEAASCMVVSAHYRQAPEHKWPAAVDDAVAAWNWVSMYAAMIGGNPAKIAIGGESAGGNLAAVTAICARDRGMKMPIHQLLIYPAVDLMNGMNSPSAQENKSARPLSQPMLNWFYNHYLPVGADRTDSRISPLYANLRGLPPATVIVAEIDPLRSDGEAYAARLSQDRVAATIHLYKGVTHEFFGMAGLVDEAGEAVKTAAQALKAAFADAGRAPPAAAGVTARPLEAYLKTEPAGERSR